MERTCPQFGRSQESVSTGRHDSALVVVVAGAALIADVIEGVSLPSTSRTGWLIVMVP
jgi:hypothetical protein